MPGYWVSTRADVPMRTVLDSCSTVQRDAAFRSGATLYQTNPGVWDELAMGCDYVAKLPRGKRSYAIP